MWKELPSRSEAARRPTPGKLRYFLPSCLASLILAQTGAMPEKRAGVLTSSHCTERNHSDDGCVRKCCKKRKDTVLIERSGKVNRLDVSAVPKEQLESLAGESVEVLGQSVAASNGLFRVATMQNMAPPKPKRQEVPRGEGGGDLAFNGTFVDARCGAKHARGSEADARCARACVKAGAQLAFVTDSGSLLRVESSDLNGDYIGHRVSLRGRLAGDTLSAIRKVQMF